MTRRPARTGPALGAVAALTLATVVPFGAATAARAATPSSATLTVPTSRARRCR